MVLVLLYTRRALAVYSGAIRARVGCRSLSASTSTSPMVSVPAEPLPPARPPDLYEPGPMVSRLVPWLAMREVMLAAAPRPMPMVVNTAATPMIMPSMVRMARSLWAAMLSKATRRYLIILMVGLLHHQS